MDDDAQRRRLAQDLQGAVLCAAEKLRDPGASVGEKASRLGPLIALVARGAEPSFALSGPREGRPHAEVVTPLITAVRAGDLAATLLLAQATAERDVGAPIAISLAVPSSRFLCPALLALGCNPGARDGYGATALHAAVRSKASLEVVQTLLAAPSLAPEALSVTDAHGVTALQLALDCAPLEVAQALLAAPGGVESLRHGARPVLCHVKDLDLAAHMLALGASAVGTEQGEPICELLERGAPPQLVAALLQAGATPAHDWEMPCPPQPLCLALNRRSYWSGAETPLPGAEICNMLLMARRAANAPLLPPNTTPSQLWASCTTPAAVEWLAATGEIANPPANVATLFHAVARPSSARDTPDLRPLARAFRRAAGAGMRGHSVADWQQLCESAVRDPCYTFAFERAARTLAAMVATGHDAAVSTALRAARTAAEGAAEEAAAAAAAADQRAAQLRAEKGAIKNVEEAAQAEALDAFIRVVSVAVQDADESVRRLALELLRRPAHDTPRLCEAVIRRAAERNLQTAMLAVRMPCGEEYTLCLKRRKARCAAALVDAISAASRFIIPPALSESDAAAQACATGAAYATALDVALQSARCVAKQSEPAQQDAADGEAPPPASPPSPRVELRCLDDGGVVCAPAAVLQWLGVLRGFFGDGDAIVADDLPALPVAHAPLQLLVSLLEAAPLQGKAATWLSENAPEAGSMPLIDALVAANKLDAPQWALWAAAEAAARALTREGSRKRARVE